MSLSFDEIVSSYERTSDSCPTIYEGYLKNGESFYVRARWGVVRLHNEASDIHASTALYSDADGFITEEEFKQFVELLYPEIEEATRERNEQINFDLWSFLESATGVSAITELLEPLSKETPGVWNSFSLWGTSADSPRRWLLEELYYFVAQETIELPEEDYVTAFPAAPFREALERQYYHLL